VATRIVVVGTGTEIGKTHVVQCLLAAARGQAVAAYKPIATGALDDGTFEDARAHAEALGASYEEPTFGYRAPISPHLAARQEGRPIAIDAIVARAREIEVDRDALFIETAGGLFSPLDDDGHTNADLLLALSPARALLVASDRLGVLHDIRACVLAASTMGVSIDAIALSSPAVADASTGRNADEVRRLADYVVNAASRPHAPTPVFTFERARFDAPSSARSALLLRDALMLASR
jgi:dethiobiotin synthetase